MHTESATLFHSKATRETQPSQYVSEAAYWAKYDEAETAYGWNDGKLDEKPVSDWQTCFESTTG